MYKSRATLGPTAKRHSNEWRFADGPIVAGFYWAFGCCKQYKKQTGSSLKTIFPQCVITYTCSLSYSDGSKTEPSE